MTRAGLQAIAVLVLSWLIGLLFVLPAAAQSTNCGPHDRVTAGLATGYGERRVSIALGANNTVVETFVSDETGTWTITVTTPDGPTCLVASGQHWQATDDPLPPQGDEG